MPCYIKASSRHDAMPPSCCIDSRSRVKPGTFVNAVLSVTCTSSHMRGSWRTLDSTQITMSLCSRLFTVMDRLKGFMYGLCICVCLKCPGCSAVFGHFDSILTTITGDQDVGPTCTAQETDSWWEMFQVNHLKVSLIGRYRKTGRTSYNTNITNIRINLEIRIDRLDSWHTMHYAHFDFENF